ncbi:hypothetical protein FRC07_003672 [Ceratobasidium sp. 392]|nr:hypothetical protein FRC07_003672 [Ceratobasidium sp. 392]
MLLTPKRHLDFPLLLETLGVSYGALFEGMGGLVYLDMAMGYLEQAAALTPDDHSDKISMLRLKDLERAMATLRYAAYLPLGYPSDKLKAARAWAAIAADVNQASELEASARIMELLPQVAWLGVPVNHRYGSLSNVECESIGMSAAAAAIGNRQYDLALEWIEQGRSIVWEQTLQLRAPFDELNSVDPMMAERFKQVSYELSRSPMHDSANQGFSHDSRKVPDAAQRRHRLAETRERLLADIRLQPRLENFLRPKASTLASLVRDGIVVIVNVWYTRCDALVLHAGAESIVHVPLADFSCDKAKLACAQLKRSLQAQDARRLFVSDALSPKDMLKQILSMLWFDVAKPVLDYLAITEILPHDDLPHITWCATGPLSFLPLHAAGDYTSPSTVLPNLAVSSYIPSLGSLRPSASSSSTFSGILTVGQESSIRGLNPLPGAKAELDEIQAQANNLPFTRLDGPSASAEAVLGAMKSHSWVHFACHASQNLGDPMKSALHLYDQNLSLATIANQQLDNAQLAFLSACQTATGDAALPDEAVHLAAGLLFAGYPTVIATMWSIKDQDAPLIARGVYERLLKDGVPDSRKAARALHSAVASLREKVGVNEFARWVPYIHIGR